MESQAIAEPLPRTKANARSRPRILFLNRSYWPDAEATGQLLTELCEDLAADFDVAVLAGQPNQNPTNAPYARSGSEKRGGVTVHRVRHTTFAKRNLLGRVVNLVTYLIAACWRALWLPSPDVLVVETDPPLLCLVGAALRRWHGSRLVVYLQDVYPDVAIALGKLREGWFARTLRSLFRRAYRGADRVVVLSRDMAELLQAWGVEQARLAIVPNWADAGLIRPVKTGNRFRRELGLEDRFVVMYSGNMGLSQRLECVLDAAERLGDLPSVVFVLIGDGATRQEIETQAKRRGLANVMIRGYVPKERLAESLSAADVQLVVLDPQLRGCLMPSKLYGVLAAGTAVLAAAPEGSELADVVVRERVGRVISFNDSRALAEAVRALAERPAELLAMGQRARRLCETEYDRRIVTRRFGQLLERTAARSEAVVGNGIEIPRFRPPAGI